MVREWDDGVFGRWGTDAFHVVDLCFGFEVHRDGQHDDVDATVQRFADLNGVGTRLGKGMVGFCTGRRETIAEIPCDEAATIAGFKHKGVKNVFDKDLLVVVALIDFNEDKSVRSNIFVDSGREFRFRWREETETASGED